MTYSPRLLVLPLACLATLAGCFGSEVETGRNGQLELVPTECGKAYCDLDDGIAVGGSLDISLRGVDGHSADGLTLVSSAPWIVDVVATERDGFEPRFRVTGTGAGRADLIAIDRNGYEVDYLPVEVAVISSLSVDGFGTGVDSIDAVGVDHGYAAPTGAELTLEVAGMARGSELTGEVVYRITLDGALAGSLLSDSDLDRGHLRLRVPAGEHLLDVAAPGGMTTRVLISGR